MFGCRASGTATERLASGDTGDEPLSEQSLGGLGILAQNWAKQRPTRRETRMQIEAFDVIERDPLERVALGIVQLGLERCRHSGDDSRVRPAAAVDDVGVVGEYRVERHASLFVGLADRGIDCALALVARAARNAPGAAVIAPTDPMLQQDAAGRIVSEQARRAKAPPVAATIFGDDPRVARVSGLIAFQGVARV